MINEDVIILKKSGYLKKEVLCNYMESMSGTSHIIITICKTVIQNPGLSARGIKFWTSFEAKDIDDICTALVDEGILKKERYEGIYEYWFLN